MLNEKQIDRMLSKLKRYEDTLDAMIFEKVADLPVSFYQTGESLYEITHGSGESLGWRRGIRLVPDRLAGSEGAGGKAAVPAAKGGRL